MNPVGKALWYIESHLTRELSLEEIAAGAETSRFHLTRAFGEATGRSPMRYARARRLTRAAQTLACGAPDILAVALEAGYSSHEAFTRSFRDQFDCTPESVRDSRNTDGEGEFDYLCGVEVPGFSQLPASLTRIRIPPQKYAVFSHTAHIASIRGTWNTIWTQWLPNSGHEVVDAPDFERYGPQFDPQTGLGGFEIWLPIKG